MTHFGRNVYFWAKKGIFGSMFAQTGPNGIFRVKSEKCHFFCIRKPQLCAKFQKIPMNGFRDLHRTHARTHALTHGRTHERELIGPNRSAGDQKAEEKVKDL